MPELKPAAYQLVALTKILRNQHNAILITDGVGVGKTISAGFALCYLTTALQRPALVVCPPSLVDKWFLELKVKFRAWVVAIRSREELESTTDYWDRSSSRPRVYLLPSSLLGKISSAAFRGIIVFDEIHNLRNPDTQQWAGAKSLADSATYRLGLSATPINNTISDLAAELALLLQLDRYSAEAVVQELWRPGYQETLYPVMTRFTKDRLGIHFASRRVHDIIIPISESYRLEVLGAIKAFRDRPRNEAVYRDELTYFRLAASSTSALSASIGCAFESQLGKVSHLGTVLKMHPSEQVIIFCEFEETTRELARAISSRPVFVITGSIPVFQREDILRRFRSETTGILIMTSVGAEGIDLQFCSTLVNYDLHWNPMVLEQRIGRIDRIGQKKSEINIYNFIVAGSIDERILATLGRKLGLLEGSVLEPDTVLGRKVPANALFTETALGEESAKAQSLAEAMRLSSEVIPTDYEVLTDIDPDFCDPETLKGATKDFPQPLWLGSSEPARTWQDRLQHDADRLKTVISRYSM